MSRLPALCALALVPSVTTAQPSSCRPAGEVTARMVDHIRDKASAVGVDADADRLLFGVPAVADTAIAVVADDSLCTRLIQAVRDEHIAEGLTPPPVPSAWVVRMGDRYAVRLPVVEPGEFSTVYVYNATYQSVGGWTGP